MGFFGLEPSVVKPTALALNLLVSAIGTFHFWRSGFFSFRTIYPFAALGIPFSLLGGFLQLPNQIYYLAVGIILVLSGMQMVRSAYANNVEVETAEAPPFLAALVTGAVIGFVSGTTGTGGGIFLAPMILAMNWVSLRRTAAVTAAFNLLNSGAALAGAYSSIKSFPAALPWWLLAVAVGGVFGSLTVSRYLSDRALRLTLATVLLVSGTKLMLS